jgi:DNA adenine methylase
MSAPPFAYYGGKANLADRIVSLLPAHEHYVEPFAGSLAVLLAKPQSRVETVNDLDSQLMTFWRVLRDRPDDLARACLLTPHSRAEHQAAYGPSVDEIEQARRLWVLLSQGRTSRPVKTGWRYAVEPKVGSLGATLHGYVDRMAALAQRLGHVSLECRPALEVIDAYGQHPDVCLYVDPPYLAETRSGTGYRHEMPTEDEHRNLAAALRACNAAVVLSGYDSPLYADLFDGWHVERMAATSSQGTGASGRVEVLWSNRPLGQQAGLFDEVAS